MPKRFWFVSLSIIIFLSAVLTPTIFAEVVAGVQLGYGSTTYSKILGTEELKATEWTDRIWIQATHEDLLFTGLYQGAHSFKGQGLDRTLAQVGANYLFFNQDALQVYGGLGYQFLNTRIENSKVESGKKSTFSGHGFVGQAIVAIPVSDEIRTAVTITGNPWSKWSFKQGTTTEAGIVGPSFVYQLDVTWDFSEDLGAHLGLLGGSFSIPSFTYGTDTKQATQGSFTGISLGVTHRF